MATSGLAGQKLHGVIPGTAVVETFVIGEPVAGTIPFGSLRTAAPTPAAPVAASDVALLPTSSGTTGLPKSVELTHRNLVASLGQSWTAQQVAGDDVVIAALPLFIAELIAAKFGFIGIGRSGRSEKIAGVQVFVAEELEDGAVKIVAAGFGGEIDDAAVESAECGGGIAGLNVELAYGVNDGKEGDLTGLRLKNGDAIVEIFVGARAAAAETRERGAGRYGDAGCKADKIDEGAAVERQSRNRARVDDGVEGCGFGAQESGVFLNDDTGGYRADSERDVYADSFAGADGDVFALVALKAVFFDGEGVATGFEARPLVNAVFVGH